MDAEDVAQVTVFDQVPARLRQVVLAQEELQLGLAVVEVGEHQLGPLAADGGNPARYSQLDGELHELLGGLLAIAGMDVGGFEVVFEAVGVGLNPGFGKILAFLTAIGNLSFELGHGIGL